MSPARKGDIVAIETTERTMFALGSGRQSESRKCWTLARVARATKAGEVVAVQMAGPGAPSQLKYMVGSPRVHTIAADKQAAAGRTFGAIEYLAPAWQSVEALRAAILANLSPTLSPPGA